MKTNFPNIICAVFFLFLAVFVNAQTAEEHYNQSLSLFEAKKYDAALTAVQKAIKSNETVPLYYIQQSNCYKSMSKYQEAYDYISEAINLMPQEAVFYVYRANMLMEAGQYDVAKEDIKLGKSVSSEADSLNWYDLLYFGAALNMYTKDFYVATQDFKKAISYNPKKEDGYLQLSYTYILMEEFETSLAILLDMEGKFSEMEIIYTNIGFSCIGLKQYDKAISYFDKALKMDPNDAYCYNNIGECKYKLGDMEGALKMINKSLSLNDKNPYAYRNRALIYLDQGKTKKACSDIEKALENKFTEMYGDEMVLLQKKHCY